MHPVKIEAINPVDYYSDLVYFFADGSVELVTYKEEGLDSFESVAEFEQWKQTLVSDIR
jgi:hypothetical protein